MTRLPPAEPLVLCHRCGHPATSRLAALSYCEECRASIVANCETRVAAHFTDESGIGTGNPTRPRSDHGDGYAELTCNVCTASWIGPRYEVCPWCGKRHNDRLKPQRDLLLHPSLPDRQSNRRPESIKAWCERLAIALTAELVTRDELGVAIRRELAP